jgi:hypothetical protein
MITAIVLERVQIADMKEHLKACEEAGAGSAVIYLASDPDEVADLNRRYEEFAQGDPPRSLPEPHVAYIGPTWVVGSKNEARDLIQMLRSDDEV